MPTVGVSCLLQVVAARSLLLATWKKVKSHSTPWMLTFVLHLPRLVNYCQNMLRMDIGLDIEPPCWKVLMLHKCMCVRQTSDPINPAFALSNHPKACSSFILFVDSSILSAILYTCPNKHSVGLYCQHIYSFDTLPRSLALACSSK